MDLRNDLRRRDEVFKNKWIVFNKKGESFSVRMNCKKSVIKLDKVKWFHLAVC